ncbi:unnamed protein product [Orchesella dallaii]|uniref:Tuberin N-terminal domain-containing protein n=1 Tax=Orchesella dallaii TaxID=48710 RepID=A0ABP1RWF2_9HEXA
MTCLTTATSNDTIACITLLSNIVMYSMIPPSTLQTVIATLCRTVNNYTLCKPTWKVMRNLLGTHLGHSGLYTLIMFLENESSPARRTTFRQRNLPKPKEHVGRT